MSVDLRLTYIGGPTVLLQLAGLRLLTDQRSIQRARSSAPVPTCCERRTGRA